jgi:hypothetical protein
MVGVAAGPPSVADSFPAALQRSNSPSALVPKESAGEVSGISKVRSSLSLIKHNDLLTPDTFVVSICADVGVQVSNELPALESMLKNENERALPTTGSSDLPTHYVRTQTAVPRCRPSWPAALHDWPSSRSDRTPPGSGLAVTGTQRRPATRARYVDPSLSARRG